MRKKTIKKSSSIEKNKQPTKPVNWDNLGYLGKLANHENFI
jgi:hypothetical protein